MCSDINSGRFLWTEPTYLCVSLTCDVVSPHLRPSRTGTTHILLNQDRGEHERSDETPRLKWFVLCMHACVRCSLCMY